jgi:putative transcriptional regulator
MMKNEIRGQRGERGLSQAQFAEALGVSRQTVIAIEGGRYSPSLALAFRMAKYFEMSIEDLFDPEEEVGV